MIKWYLYDTIFSNTPLKMFKLNLESDALKIKYDDLNNFSTATFSLSLDSDVKKLQKFIIFDWNIEIFNWYVSNFKPVLDKTNAKLEIECSSQKRYMSELCLLDPLNIVSQPVDNILIELQSQLNSNWFSRTFETDGSIVSKKAWRGSTWFDVLSDLWLQRLIINWKIIIKEQVWINRSIWVNIQELSYSPYNSNVSKVEILTKNNNANVVIWKTKSQGIFIYPTPLPNKITWITFKEFRDWDVQWQTIKYYNTLWLEKFVYSVTAEQWAIDANVWDIVWLRIQWFWKFNISTNVFVLSKTSLYKDWTLSIWYQVSEWTAPIEWIIEDIKNLRRDIRIMQTE